MRTHKPRAPLNSVIMRELAGHVAMGATLGLVSSLTMILSDTLGLRNLIAHGADAQAVTVIFVGTFTLALAAGATVTGFVFTITEDR